MSDTSKQNQPSEAEPRVNIAITATNHENLKRAAFVRKKSLRDAADEAVSKWVGKPEKLRAELIHAIDG
jgi:CheY-like chemotaxis protein